MRVVVAPDSFKEALGARAVCEAIARGLEWGWPGIEVVQVPMADGGEGTVSALVAAAGGRMVPVEVEDPLGRTVTAEFALLDDGRTAVVEMAAASGLDLLRPGERDPLRTSTYGTGQLVSAALDAGAGRVIVGLGGSATVDGGVGAAQALGVEFRDGRGRPVGRGGGALEEIASISLAGLDPRVREARIEAACDVTNPLLGPAGAARVFAPQKGADPAAVERLEAGLAHLAALVERDLGRRVRSLAGGGAAGGLGAGLAAFLGAELRPGVELVADAVRLDEHVAAADLVVTGEGRLDGQSAGGKTVSGVTAVARRRGVPVVALVGALGGGWRRLLEAGLLACFPIQDRPAGLETALARTAERLAESAEQLARLLRTAWEGPRGASGEARGASEASSGASGPARRRDG